MSRRRYNEGTCEDCGHHKRVTVIRFWLNGMSYRVCADCKRAYLGRILDA